MKLEVPLTNDACQLKVPLYTHVLMIKNRMCSYLGISRSSGTGCVGTGPGLADIGSCWTSRRSAVCMVQDIRPRTVFLVFPHHADKSTFWQDMKLNERA